LILHKLVFGALVFIIDSFGSLLAGAAGSLVNVGSAFTSEPRAMLHAVRHVSLLGMEFFYPGDLP
jgi:hypothetical protein